MAEEQEEKGGTSIKSILIGLVSTITLGVGGFITNKLTGGEEEKPAAVQAAPVINITNSNQQAQQQSAGGKTVIIKEKAVGGNTQPAPAPKPKKKEGDEFKEEAPKW
jgi:outer membrane scaffolding protein for murein synthesis (MipA/OmpV family)